MMIDHVSIRPGDIVLAEGEAILTILRKDAERILLKTEEIIGTGRKVWAEAAWWILKSNRLDRYGHICVSRT